MKPSWARGLAVVALAGLAFLYYYRLADAPISLAHDEAMFGVVAHEIGWHARDVDGQVLPLFMPMSGVYWNMPAHVYLTALFVRAFGTTEAVIRASSATASLVAVVLVYAFCRRVFRHRGFAALAAGMLALSPAFFIDSRLSTDHHYPLVAIGFWLLCLARFFDDPRRTRWIGLAGISLGAGIYTYGASVLLMPIYVALTGLLLVRARIRRVQPYAVLGAAFAVAALPFLVFLLTHPRYVGDVAKMYSVYDSRRFNVLQGAHEVLNWTSLSARSDVYFSYFNPSMLFVSGASSVVQSTRQAGFFLLPFLILLPAAIIYVLKHDAEWYAWLALTAFFATPLAASIVDERGAVQRVISLAPFGAILVACLVMRVTAGSRPWLRTGTWFMVALLPLAFARFHADYLGDYRLRSAFYFEQNIRGALEAAIEETRHRPGSAGVCLSRGMNPLVEWYWKFYVRKHGAESLEPRTAYFDKPADARAICAEDSIVVAESAACAAVGGTTGKDPRTIVEPDGSPSFCVF